jgi:hypothetical protein
MVIVWVLWVVLPVRDNRYPVRSAAAHFSQAEQAPKPGRVGAPSP